MQDINKPSDPTNRAGLREFWYIAESDIASVPVARDNMIPGAVVLKPGKVWYSFYVTKFSLDFDERLRETKHGDRYDQKLEGVVPKDSPELAKALSQIRGKIAIVYKDLNGFYKLIRNTTFTSRLATGRRPGSGTNGVDISFEARNVEPAYFYNGVVGTGTPGPAPEPTGDPVKVIRGTGDLVSLLAPAGSTLRIISDFSVEFELTLANS